MDQFFFRTRFLGTHYHGWQVQDNARTVQGEVNRVLKDLLRLKDAPTLGCGRTDKGVHAEDFYFSLWAEPSFELEELRFKMNNYLPQDIAVRSIYRAPSDAHVRFDPEQRSYIYRIHREKDPFLYGRSYYMHASLDSDPMHEAAEYLLGCSYFGAFARTGGNTKTDICRLDRVEWSIDEERAFFRISADRFLRGMVRGIVGTMLELGCGKFGMDHFKAIVASRDRTRAGSNAPAHGLYLSEVRYPYALS